MTINGLRRIDNMVNIDTKKKCELFHNWIIEQVKRDNELENYDLLVFIIGKQEHEYIQLIDTVACNLGIPSSIYGKRICLSKGNRTFAVWGTSFRHNREWIRDVTLEEVYNDKAQM